MWFSFVRWCRYTVACSLGTWYNSATGTCELCPAGTFQDVEGQLECKSCPHKLHGVGTEGAKTTNECGGAPKIKSNQFILPYFRVKLQIYHAMAGQQKNTKFN